MNLIIHKIIHTVLQRNLKNKAIRKLKFTKYDLNVNEMFSPD